MTQTEQLYRRYNAAMTALCGGIGTIIKLARGLADSEATLPADSRPAARSRYLIKLYEAAGAAGAREISQLYDELTVLRPRFSPTSAEVAELDALSEQCRAVLEQVNILQHRLLPQHMRTVSDGMEAACRIDRNVTAGFVRALEILMANIQKFYCPNEADVL